MQLCCPLVHYNGHLRVLDAVGRALAGFPGDQTLCPRSRNSENGPANPVVAASSTFTAALLCVNSVHIG